ncbi:MAG: hypothetical protein EOO05_20865, partial [Chitinophagaceae bacterium]
KAAPRKATPAKSAPAKVAPKKKAAKKKASKPVALPAAPATPVDNVEEPLPTEQVVNETETPEEDKPEM